MPRPDHRKLALTIGPELADALDRQEDQLRTTLPPAVASRVTQTDAVRHALTCGLVFNGCLPSVPAPVAQPRALAIDSSDCGE